jgi:hypothetical protein
MDDTSFNKLMKVNAMASIFRQLILFTTLSFTLTAQAAQDGKHEMKENLASPSVARSIPSSESRQSEIDGHESLNERLKESVEAQRSNRYGIGYEMRQGRQSNTQGGGHGR